MLGQEEDATDDIHDNERLLGEMSDDEDHARMFAQDDDDDDEHQRHTVSLNEDGIPLQDEEASEAKTERKRPTDDGDEEFDIRTHIDGGVDENDNLRTDAPDDAGVQGDRRRGSKRKPTLRKTQAETKRRKKKQQLLELYKHMVAYDKVAFKTHQVKCVESPTDWPSPKEIEWIEPNKAIFFLTLLMLYTWQCLERNIAVHAKAQQYFDYLHVIYMQVRPNHDYRISNSAEQNKATDIWFITLMHLRILKVAKFVHFYPGRQKELRDQGLVMYDESVLNYTLKECDVTLEQLTTVWRKISLTPNVRLFWETLQIRVAMLTCYLWSRDFLDDPNMVNDVDGRQCIVNFAVYTADGHGFLPTNFVLLLTDRLQATPITANERRILLPFVQGFRRTLTTLSETVDNGKIHSKFVDMYLEMNLRFHDYEDFSDKYPADDLLSSQNVYARLHKSMVATTYEEMNQNWAEILKGKNDPWSASYVAFIFCMFHYVIQQKFQGYDFYASHCLPITTHKLATSGQLLFFSRWSLAFQEQLAFPFILMCNREPIVFIPRPDPANENKRHYIARTCETATEAVIFWAACINKYCGGQLKGSAKLNITRWLKALGEQKAKEKPSVPMAKLPNRIMDKYIINLKATLRRKAGKEQQRTPFPVDRFDIDQTAEIARMEQEDKRALEEKMKGPPQPLPAMPGDEENQPTRPIRTRKRTDDAPTTHPAEDPLGGLGGTPHSSKPVRNASKPSAANTSPVVGDDIDADEWAQADAPSDQELGTVSDAQALLNSLRIVS